MLTVVEQHLRAPLEHEPVVADLDELEGALGAAATTAAAAKKATTVENCILKVKRVFRRGPKSVVCGSGEKWKEVGESWRGVS